MPVKIDWVFICSWYRWGFTTVSIIYISIEHDCCSFYWDDNINLFDWVDDEWMAAIELAVEMTIMKTIRSPFPIYALHSNGRWLFQFVDTHTKAPIYSWFILIFHMHQRSTLEKWKSVHSPIDSYVHRVQVSNSEILAIATSRLFGARWCGTKRIAACEKGKKTAENWAHWKWNVKIFWITEVKYQYTSICTCISSCATCVVDEWFCQKAKIVA